jgi:hypothetical protein
LRFYDYKSSSPLQVNSISQISIEASTDHPPVIDSGTRDAMSNFTVLAQPSNFTIGGPSNESEGITVEYLITANPNSNGTYIMNFGWLLGSYGQQPVIVNCLEEFSLIVGNGIPNYYGGCTAYMTGIDGHLFANVTSYSDPAQE